MVSPYKKLKSSKSEFILGGGPSKIDAVKSRGSLQRRSSSSSPLDKKPLLGKKVYLDVKNRSESNKLENRLRSVGAEVLIFLTKDVNLVITDHPEESVSNGLCSPAASISPVTVPSPATEAKPSTPRSRASAMLDRVPLAGCRRLVSSLELAQLWGVPVLSVSQAHKWLTWTCYRKIRKPQPYKTYIKIESTLGLNKPELLELDKWPDLNVSGYLGECPFRSPSPSTSSSHSQSKEDEEDVRNGRTESTARPAKRVLTVTNRQLGITMTRRVLKNSISNDEDGTKSTQPICNGHITRQSSQELLKVQCNGLGSSPARHSSKLLSPSGSDVLPLPTLRRATRRASASWCGSTRELAQLSPDLSSPPGLSHLSHFSQLSPSSHSDLESPTGITLRPKGQLWLPVALIGTTAEENGNSIRRRFDQSAVLTKVGSNSHSDSSINSDTTYCVVTRNAKRDGHEDANGLDGTELGDMRPRKKRSFSVCAGAASQTAKHRQRTNSVTAVVKKKLTHEEKFLLDNRDYFKMEVLNTKLRSSNVSVNSSLNVTTTAITKPIDKIIIKKIQVKGKRKRSKWAKKKAGYAAIIIDKVKPQINGGQQQQQPPPLQLPKKKRQSQLMKLCDEAESFMFGECSRSTAGEVADAEEEKRTDVKEETSMTDSLLDSSRGSWDDCGSRRKKRRSHAEAFIHDNMDYYKFETPGSRLRHQSVSEGSVSGSVKCEMAPLCFSFEAVPSLEPWFQVYGRQDQGLENLYPVLSHPDDEPFLLPYEMPRPLHQPDAATISEYYKRRRKRLAMLSNLPRKSPRCHASTLAILSSLKKRKRRSTTNLREAASAAAAPDAGPVEEEVETDVLQFLDAGSEWELEDGEACEGEVLGRRRGLTMDVVSWLDTAKTCHSMDDPEPDTRPDTDSESLADTDPKRRRKKPRKINRTGWDKKVRRKLGARKDCVEEKDNKPLESAGDSVASVAVPCSAASRSVSADSSSREYAPCVVRVRKMKVPLSLTSSVTLRSGANSNNVAENKTTSGAKRHSELRRRRRKVNDYSWSSKKR